MKGAIDSGLSLMRRLRRDIRLHFTTTGLQRAFQFPVAADASLDPEASPLLDASVTCDARWLRQPVLIGWFVTADSTPHNSTRLAEGRIMPRRDRADGFSFSLPVAEIAAAARARRATLWLDMVLEGAFWFHDHKGAPHRLVLDSGPRVSRAAAAAQEWLRAAAPVASAGLLADVAPLNLAAPLAEARRRASLKPPAGDELAPWPGPPRHQHANAAPTLRDLAGAVPRGLADPAALAPSALLARALSGRGGWSRIRPEHRAYFQRTRLHHADSGTPLTAAMLDATALAPLKDLPRILANANAARDWWLFEVVLRHGLPIDALPPAHLAHWRATGLDDATPPVSHFVHAAQTHHAPDEERPRAADEAGRLALLFRHVLREFQDPRAAALTGPAVLGFLRQPVAAMGREATLFQVLVAQALCAVGNAPFAQFAEALDEARAIMAQELPQLAPLLPDAPPAAQPVMLVGHNNRSGLGENFRMFVGAFARSGIATRIFDAEHGDALTQNAAGELVPLSQQPGRATTQAAGTTLPAAPSLFMVNPDRMAMLAVRQDFAGLVGRRRIGFFLSEMHFQPPAVVAACDQMDEIWTPSEFVRDAYAACSRAPVFNVGKALHWPDDVPNPYPAMLPDHDERFVFMTSFDPGSWLRRKNPTAAVSAFLAAFPRGHEPVALVVKVPQLPRNHPGDPFDEWSLIEAAAARDSRIIIHEAFSSFAEYLGHIAHADCVLSPHRSEGFGYLCAQAHHFATPLICTGYSGNMDFCMPDNAWLIEYDMRAVTEGEFLPGTRGTWADVRIPHLAQLMRQVVAEPERAARMAEAGRALLQDRYSPARFDATIQARLSA